MKLNETELEVYYRNTTQIGTIDINETLFDANKNTSLPLTLKIDERVKISPTTNSTGIDIINDKNLYSTN